MTPTPEYIVAAAIWHDKTVWSLPKPARHADIINLIGEKSPRTVRRLSTVSDCGFVTSAKRFVGRKEAAAVAYHSGQILDKIDILTSEDVW